tara:strand:- start:394 stop:1350 length:957 start_codon:yes stop_codon:yes gene_type:complete
MNKEFKIGFVVLIVLVMLIVGVNYLKGLNILSSNNKKYYAQYEDIGGLQVGSSVRVNGYQVGMVSDIDLLIQDRPSLLVTLILDKEFSIPNNSTARIVNQDLMGTKGVSLILGDTDVYVKVGDTLNSSIEGSLQEEVNAQILPLKRKAEELIGSMDSLMIIVTAILNKDARANLSNSLNSLDRTFVLMSETMQRVSDIVGENDERINNVIINLESISENIKNSNGAIENTLSNLSSISDSLVNTDISSIVDNFNAITQQINNGQGSLGLLIKDDRMYNNLERSTKELAELVEDIKNNPSRYINFSLVGRSSSYKKKNK